jgi:hypothetical protein
MFGRGRGFSPKKHALDGCSYIDSHGFTSDLSTFGCDTEADGIKIGHVTQAITNALKAASESKAGSHIHNDVVVMLQKYRRMFSLFAVYDNANTDLIKAACHSTSVKYALLKAEASKYIDINTKVASIIDTCLHYKCDYRRLYGNEYRPWRNNWWNSPEDFVDDVCIMAESISRMTSMFDKVTSYYATYIRIQNNHE